MHRALLLVLLAATACAAARTPPAAAPAGADPVPVLQLPEGVRPVRAALSLALDPGADGFSGEVTYDLVLAEARPWIWLNGQGLAVTRAEVVAGAETVAARYQEVDPAGVARVIPARPVGPGPVRLRLAWRAPWTPGLSGLFRTELEGRRYLVTQFESVSARRAFPCFDEPRFKIPWDVTLEVPTGLVAVGNTAPVTETTSGGGRRVVLAATRPLPAYLVAIAVGPWEVVEAGAPPNEVRAAILPVRGLAPAGHGAELAFALREGNALLAALERWFGTPFPYMKLDHLAAPDFGPGGMENAGLIVYARQFLLLSEGTASRQARTNTRLVLAHELSHQWFGDLVTMPWWTETWLNESFATWIEAEVVDAWRPESHARRLRLQEVEWAMGQDALAAARAVRQPLERIEAVNDQFDGLSYAKGAAVIDMVSHWVGPEAFRSGVRAYLAAHADGSGDAEQLYAAVSAAAGRDTGPVFRSFLDQPGFPEVTARTVCEGGRARLELAQRRWRPLGSRAGEAGRWSVPICARWSPGGAADQRCTLLTEATGSVPLGDGCPAWVLPMAGGAGYFRVAQPPRQLEALRTAGWASLTVEERLAVAQGAVAALETGALPVAEAVPLLEALARDPDGDVATAPWLAASRLVERVASPERREAARRWGARLYAPALARLGLAPRSGEPDSDARLRVLAARFTAQVGRDPALRARLAAMGNGWLEAGGEAQPPGAVPPDLAALAAAVAVEDGGATAFDAAVRRLAVERDEGARRELLDAIAKARDPALVDRAQALDVAPGRPISEFLFVARRQAATPWLEQAGWDAFRRGADEQARRAPERASRQPSVAGGFCDATRLAEVRAFFGPRVERSPGMARPLAEAAESIERCMAAVAAHRPGFDALLTGRSLDRP